jgi:MYND finger
MSSDIFQQLCGGCGRVPGTVECGGCRRKKYCSTACQRSQWKTKHRPICAFLATLLPPAPTTEPVQMLDLDNEKGNLLDFDSALDFAAQRLGPTLKHFKAWVPQELTDRPPKVKFTAENLEKFLRSCLGSSPLISGLISVVRCLPDTPRIADTHCSTCPRVLRH